MREPFVVRRSDSPGLDVDHLFLAAAFNIFQAGVQDKRLMSFATPAPGGEVALTLAARGGAWTSPVTGAFGGLAATGRNSAQAAFAVVDSATDWLRNEADAQRAAIRLAPGSFADPSAAAVENALFRSGWRLDQVDLNFHLPVTASDAFIERLGETKRKEIRRLIRSGAAVRRLDGAEARTAYEVIAQNRAALGYPMTMSWGEVEALALAFPDRVSFHAVQRDGCCLAGAICLAVSRTYDYVFYWGEAVAARRESPVILLAQGIMADAHNRGVAIVDLGVSTEQSAPNAGLIAFKESLGCQTTARRTYVLDLR